jgi:hypothetical protein
MAADAPWCTLCLTPRPQPAPVIAAAGAEAAPLRIAAPHASLYAPVTPASFEPSTADPTWPCHSCGTAVPLAADSCPECGGGFLGGSGATPSLTLPLVGDVTQRSKPQMYALAAALGLGVAVLLVTVVVVIALIF